MSLKRALFEGESSWFTYQLIVQNPSGPKVKGIVAVFDDLISWLQAFFVLTPITDKPALECFVARLKASRYTFDETLIGSNRPSGKMFELYSHCQTLFHYCLCKHCVARAMMDGVITHGPPQFAPERRLPEQAKRGRKRKARRGDALNVNG